MSQKWVPRVAWGLGAIVSAGSLGIIGRELARLGPDQNILRLAVVVVWALFPVVFSLLAALILSRQPRNLVGWLLMIPAATLVLSGPVDTYLNSFSTAPPPGSLPILLMSSFSNWGWTLLIFPLLLIPLVFPTGKPPSPRWRWILWILIGMCVFFIFIASFAERLGPLEGSWQIVNPVGFIPGEVIEGIILPWLVALGSLTLACLASLFVRYRYAGAVEREQIKWLLYACGMFAVVYVPALVFEIPVEGGGMLNDAWELLFSLSLLTIAVSIAIAITRYRLWDIDVIIRRTLVYGLLTAMLALVYFGGVVIFQRIFNRISGEAGQSPLAIVLSTLAIAALFTPLRRRIQHSIDRRFFRRKYNAELILQAFTTSLRNEVDLEQLSGHLVNIVTETMQPSSVSLWLREAKKR